MREATAKNSESEKQTKAERIKETREQARNITVIKKATNSKTINSRNSENSKLLDFPS